MFYIYNNRKFEASRKDDNVIVFKVVLVDKHNTFVDVVFSSINSSYSTYYDGIKCNYI